MQSQQRGHTYIGFNVSGDHAVIGDQHHYGDVYHITEHSNKRPSKRICREHASQHYFDEALNEHTLQQFKRDLSFDYVDSRQQLYEAFPDTFEWIWAKHSNDSHQPWDSFPDWLRSGSDIYWIQGKAGSGKSTLMDYIRGNRRLHEHLRIWSGGRPVVIPIFFFWRAGSSEQRNVSGLLRSLILQILHQGPQSLDQTLWPFLRARTADMSISRVQPQRHIKTLIQILQSILRTLSESHHICILIDGVDELEGTPAEKEHIISVIQDLSLMSNTKLCVSSRPDAHLVNAFSSFPGLRLQDLNRRDISLFIKKKLNSMEHLHGLSHQYRKLSFHLRNEISEKAEGVFLWASLAIGQVWKGCCAMDNATQLIARVSHLSGSLNDVFRHTLESFDDEYKEDFVKLMTILRRLEHFGMTTRSAVMIAFATQDQRFTHLMDICYGNDDEAIGRKQLVLWHDEITRFSNTLRTRYAGFIDIAHSTYFGKQWWHELESGDAFPMFQVEVMHKSVLDFLEQDSAAKQLFSNHVPAPDAIDSMIFEVSTLEPC